MAFSKKKPDPISDKARALERRDRRAGSRDQEARLATVAHGRAEVSFHRPCRRAKPFRALPKNPRPTAPKTSEPVFEEVSSARLAARAEAEAPELFNELGVRKYDLPALFNRLRNHLRGPTTSNPRLVNYLAAGGVQGLRPLRYEKRVARNRFIWLVVVVSVVLFGLAYVLLPKH